MSVNFSDQLKDRYKAYMHQKHGVVISDDQIQQELNSLADLHNAFFPTTKNPSGSNKTSLEPLVE